MKASMLRVSVFLLFCVIESSVDAFGQTLSVVDSIQNNLAAAEQLKPVDPDAAIEYAKSAKEMADRAGLNEEGGFASRALARLYAEKGDYTNSVEQALNALRVFQELKNDKLACSMYIILGVVYRYQHHYTQSLEYYREAEALALTNNFDTLKAAIWGNMGNVYYDMRDNDQALAYHTRSLELDERLNNRQGMGNSYHNIGMLYRSKGELRKAIEFYQRSLDIDEELGNMRNQMISYMDFAELYLEMSDYPKALENANKALAIGKQTGYERLMPRTLGYLSVIHAALGHHQEALKFFRRAYTLTDSLHAETLSEQIAEMQTRYETEQKERELSLQNLEIAAQKSSINQQRLLISVLGSVLLFSSLIGYLLFNRYKLRQRNRQLKLENEQLVMAGNLQERKEIDDTINYFATSLFGKNTVQEILWDVAKNCIERLGLVDCVIYLLDEERQVLVQKAAYGLKNPEGFVIHEPIEIPVGKGIVGTVAKTGESEIVGDTQNDARYIVDDEARASEMAVPLIQQGRVIGVIDSEHHQKGFFKKQHLEALKTIAAICTSKIAQTEAYEQAAKAQQAQLEAEQIKKMDTIKSRFFANISHEFRTPLNLILAPLQHGKEAIPAHELEMMRRNARRLLRLVNQLLDLARIEVGLMKVENRNIDIAQFLRGIAESFSPLADAREISYTISIPDSDHRMSFDADKLEKIVYNLLSNAFKFTPGGGSVSLTTTIEPTHFVLEISDTGIGIPDHLKEEIFKRFYQIDASQTREYEGTGIGLSLTKELVDLLQGTITVRNGEESGCVFSVRLPYTQPSGLTIDQEEPDSGSDPFFYSEDYQTGNTSQVEQLSEGPENLPVILFAEDNKDLRSFVKGRLQVSFVVLEAANGVEALTLAKEKVPDLIITDIMMPEMDGVELTRSLRSDNLTNHIPILLLTARDDGETKIRGFETGAEQYLVKPFDIDELIARINGLLAQRNRLRQKYSREVTLQPRKVMIQDRDAVFLEKLMSIIEENMSNTNFTVDSLQREIGMSRMQLHRKLKALTDQSATEFIRDVKLNKAAQILSQPGVQVAEAAYLSGFNHLSYFAKCFKERFGISPSAYAATAAGIQTDPNA